MATAILARHVGAIVKEAAAKGKGWCNPHMAAASAAILERIPLIDLIIEVRDSRIPLSSAYKHLQNLSSSSKRLIVLNKMDLADRIQTMKWMRHFEEQNCACYGVNSHNKDDVKKFLQFLRDQLRELKANQAYPTAAIMLVGIPNVGKSAIANSLHQIGRISAAEKGKLKHAIVSSLPGETKDISSYKIASHPNIYVLDTPGVLAPEIVDADTCCKLTLTGAIKDCLVGEYELARYFLAILSSCGEYRRWEKLKAKDGGLCADQQEKLLASLIPNKRKRQYPTDHTQDYIVKDVRRVLFETISCFKGNLDNENELVGLIEVQFLALHEAFRVPLESGEDGQRRVATKLLNLFRTGRLGHYTLDSFPHHAI